MTRRFLLRRIDMSIDEIINHLNVLASVGELAEETGKVRDINGDNSAALRMAIALLKTHPAAQPNDPLTLEELRRMKGEPVWLKEGLKVGEWAIVLGREDFHYMYFTAWRGTMRFPIEDCGTVWLAYRRPPKEDDHA